MDWKIG
jgi:hypothetical protein